MVHIVAATNKLDISTPSLIGGTGEGWGEGFSRTPILVKAGRTGEVGDLILYTEDRINWPSHSEEQSYWFPRYTYVCRCGAVWYQDDAWEDDEDEEDTDVAPCPSCGCTRKFRAEKSVPTETFLFDDEHKVAIVGFVTTYCIRAKQQRVKGSLNDYQYVPQWIYPRERKWRVTHNLLSGKTTIVTFEGRKRNEVVLPLYGRTRTGLDHLKSYYDHIDQSVLIQFVERLMERLPAYLIEEYGLNALRETETVEGVERHVAYRRREEYLNRLMDLFQLHAHPHLADAGKLFISPRSVSERRKIESAKGQLAMHRVVFPALTKKTLAKTKEVAALGDPRMVEVLSLISDPNLYRLGLDNIHLARGAYHNVGNFTVLCLAWPVTVREGFVNDLFGDQESFNRRIREARVSREALGLVVDSLHLYYALRRQMPVKELRGYVEDWRGGSIRQVHDGLSRISWQRENRQIAYDYPEEHTARYSREIGQVSFRLPETDYDLKMVSSYMNNCVSGYREDMEKRLSYIVTGYVEDDPYVCIGVDGKRGHVFEVKARFNRYLSKKDEYLNAILTYIREIGGNPLGVADLNHLVDAPAIARKDLELNVRPARHHGGGYYAGGDNLPF